MTNFPLTSFLKMLIPKINSLICIHFKHYPYSTNCHENDKTDYNGGTGEIVVKIYKTRDVPRKPSSGEQREPREPR
jgi:hypothetical protein